jgi:hypothetical protein
MREKTLFGFQIFVVIISIIASGFIVFQGVKWIIYQNKNGVLFEKTGDCQYHYDKKGCNEEKKCELMGGFIFNDNCLFPPK